MKNLFFLILFYSTCLFGADVKISQLPLGSGASVGLNDSFPFVAASSGITKRLTIYDLVNVPAFAARYAPLASPTFTGVVTSPSFVGPLTGNTTGTHTGSVVGNVTGNASTASALASTPSACTSGSYATGIAASGNANCSQVSFSQLSGTTGTIVNSNISSSAAIALSKLAALTASKVLVSDASGIVSPSAVSSTTLGYLDATSSIQTQIDSKQAAGNYITALTGDVTASGPGSAAATIGAGKVTNAMLAGSIDLTAKVTGALPAANGGTGQSTFTKGDVLAASGSTTLSKLGVGADGTVLTADSTQATGIKWGSVLSNPMTTSGDIIYGGASGAPTRLAKSTDGMVLKLASGLPAWANPSVASNSSAAERIERACFGTGNCTTVCSASPCSTVTQSGTWISSVVRNSAGSYTITIAASIFSAAPECVVTNKLGNRRYISSNATSATTLNINTDDSAGAAADSALSIICMGTR